MLECLYSISPCDVVGIIQDKTLTKFNILMYGSKDCPDRVHKRLMNE